ncbi:Protein of unknown function (DUF2993) [Xenococcus sp. PCC 7305]|uniref:LmeA family phospholipid-binding protein n=1 Tax=Xenococcus sp. PCC 7305 TaxID=102125 RepID=UPI0002AC5033|nr:DUF2993 domain-containing protein [Xenococcus sp. PCC 7305]ELS00974.1 Protein of unknown function (DUF2993) [Xenococcus sp. PCC 7305]
MIIDKLLASAVKIYLRSQVEQVKNLKVKIKAKDRQILSGELPQVLIAANAAVYQGIYLRQLEVTGNNILLNLPEILERKPLKLLEPIIVNVQALLTASDLQSSLASDLFLSGLADFWRDLRSQQVTVSQGNLPDDSAITWQQIALQDNVIIMAGNLENKQGKDIELKITTDLHLSDPQTLVFTPLDIQGIPELSSEKLQPLKIDLGEGVAIANLAISQNKLFASAEITIFP